MFKSFIINICKPVGLSSAEVVSFFRKRFPRRYFGKIGHLGTLDPFADGVLLLGISSGLRVASYSHEWTPKTYYVRGILGSLTDTGDCTGKVIETSKILPFPKGWEETLKKNFEGDYLQSPHYFSAAKHQGRPLYYYARKGIKVEKQKVLRKVYSLKDLKYADGYFSFTCRVSSGTYIRVLFEDMVRLLGQLGHLVELTRTEIGNQTIRESLREEEWDLPLEDLLSRCLGLEECLPLDNLFLNEKEGELYRQGVSISVGPERYSYNSGRVSGEHCWVYRGFGEDNKLLGLAEKRPKGPKVCFNLPF